MVLWCRPWASWRVKRSSVYGFRRIFSDFKEQDERENESGNFKDVKKRNKIMYQDRNFVKAWEFPELLYGKRSGSWRTGLCHRGGAQQRLPPCGGCGCAHSGGASFGP